MQRIRKEDGAIKDSKGRWIFSEGDPSPGGHPPTRLTAKFMNSLMEEIIYAIENSGLTLAASEESLLYTAIQRTSRHAYYDLIVGSGSGEYPSLGEALQHVPADGKAKILVTKSEQVTASISLSKPDLLIEFAPGVTFTGSPTLGEGETDPAGKAIFKVESPSITVRGGRFGFAQSRDDQNAFYTTERGRFLLLDAPRLFGFGTRSGFAGRSPVQTTVFVKE